MLLRQLMSNLHKETLNMRSLGFVKPIIIIYKLEPGPSRWQMSKNWDHLPPHKYIKNTSICATIPKKHLLNAGRRPQTSKKPRNSPLTWLCGWQGLGALAGYQAWASEVGGPSSGHWTTRDLLAPRTINQESSPRDLCLNAKTQLHSTTSKFRCWMTHAKQLTWQEHNPTH